MNTESGGGAVRRLRERLGTMTTRQRATAIAGSVVALGAVATLLTLLIGGGDDPPPPAKPLVLRAPTALDDVFNLAGEHAELSAADLEAVVDTVKAYLRAATIAPLEHDPGDDEAPTPVPLARFFTDAAAPRLDGADRLALADDHLPHAKHGVSTERAELTLAALVEDDGSAALVAASIDVSMVVRTGGDHVIVDRSGDLVLEPAEGGGFLIGGYEITAERTFASETTTTEAAFR